MDPRVDCSDSKAPEEALPDRLGSQDRDSDNGNSAPVLCQPNP